MSQVASPAAKAAPTRRRKAPQPSIAAAPAPRRFIKLDDQGNELPADATGHVAVLDVRQQLIFLVASSPQRLTHKQAEKYAAGLDAMGHAWRLPTVEELFLIADRGSTSPAIDVDFFPGTHSAWYWTSTPAAWSPSSFAWFVHFNFGGAHYHHRSYDAFVRAVRSVGVPSGQ